MRCIVNITKFTDDSAEGGRGAPVAPVPRSATVYDVFYVDIMLIISYFNYYISIGWLGSREVSMLDSGAERPGFKSQPRRSRVTVLGKLFTPIVPLLPSSKIDSSPLKGCEGNCRLGGK